jgi:magnesium-transporting ATPase (P-type)
MGSLPEGEVTEAPADPSQGLSAAEARRRLQRDGPNELPRPRPPSAVGSLLAQLTHFFAVLLWFAVVMAWVAGMVELAVAIAVVVVVNAVFAFVQEHRAERAAERLQDLVPRRAIVRRDGELREVDAAELVVGDIVHLEGGDRVSADLVALEASALAVDESLLSGESVPNRPGRGALLSAGTFVIEGEAVGVVGATGPRTRLGRIASLTRAGRRPTSPIALELHRVVRVIAAVSVGLGASFFAVAVALGMPSTDGFLFAVGVTVALVPEGLLPTVTLSLAMGAQRMAARHALVRRLEAVETLGSTTFICTDKTGTLTRNEMAAVALWTPAGSATVRGLGYEPSGDVEAETGALPAVRDLALAAARCSSGRAVEEGGVWVVQGDPMEAALAVLAYRCGVDLAGDERARPVTQRFPFDPHRRRMSVALGGTVMTKGAPEAVLPRCAPAPGIEDAWAELGRRGLRVLAVARGSFTADERADADSVERNLQLLGLIGLEDPPRRGAASAVASCRRAGIRVAMVTGDHPATAEAIAREVGLVGPEGGLVTTGADLPEDDAELGGLLDRDGVVVARVSPEDKLRIARALQGRGHVVAMTGDGVNDGPALRQADIGVAMGRSGTDVAREAADLVLLDDDFATIVTAIEQGRATFANVRRFLTYHLTDNVAELAPFVMWALSAGAFPLALGVLQILALDIGTDLLPALALGGEAPSARALSRPPSGEHLIDRSVLERVFGVLGPAEAIVEMVAFTAVLVAGGWRWGEAPAEAVLLAASGTAFTAVVLGQLANAFACRSTTRRPGQLGWTSNRLLIPAVGVELIALLVFVAMPAVAGTLDQAPPTLLGLALAAMAIPAVLAADAAQKRARAAAVQSGGM